MIQTQLHEGLFAKTTGQKQHIGYVHPIKNKKGINDRSFLWDDKGEQYLDFYGGHAVISIGHNHPHYQNKLKDQLEKISFYSNSVQNELQTELAEKLGKLSGYEDYNLFLCNSGAEANENALKLASFHNGKNKVLYFSGSFHGRTSAAVSVTDNPKIVAPVNFSERFIKSEWNDVQQLEETFEKYGNEISSVIIEGIQGVGGIMIDQGAYLRAGGYATGIRKCQSVQTTCSVQCFTKNYRQTLPATIGF